jgi:Protein of unknown function (DUF3311)
VPEEHQPDVRQSDVRTGQPVVTPSRIAAGICLIIPFVALLWVNSYSRLTPTFIGIPFFYWYQLAWVPVAAALTFTAYLLVRREERVRKGGSAK